MGNELITRNQLQSDLENLYNNKISPYLNGATHTGFTPVGTIISYFGEIAPAHYLICDGATYNKSDYPELWTHLSSLTDTTPYVVDGDNTKFKVPDLRGEFLRGTGTNGHENQGSGGDVGEHQDATELIRFLTNSSLYSYNYWGVSDSKLNEQNADGYIESISGDKQSYATTNNLTINPGTPIRYMTRPTNTSVLFCIAYKDIYIDYALDGFPVEITNPQDKQGLTFDATSQKWVNGIGGLHEYSTTEKVVGTWIDGRPIYEKTFYFSTTLSVSNNNWIDTGITRSSLDAEALIEAKGFRLQGTLTNCFGLFAGFIQNSDNVNLLAQRANGGIDVTYLILTYTKTTDTPTVQS